MIFDVLNLFDTKIRNANVGLNARIAAVDAAYGTTTPVINEFITWDLNKLPNAFRPPTVLVVWEGTPTIELVQQGKWNADHLISLQWFSAEKNPELVRKHAAVLASALLSFVDYMSAQAPIMEARTPSIQVSSWQLAGKHWTWLSIGARYKERDESPVIVLDP